MDIPYPVNSPSRGVSFSREFNSGSGVMDWYPELDYDQDANDNYFVPGSYEGEIEASEKENSSQVEVALQTSRARYRVLVLYFISSLFQFYLISSLNPLTKTNESPGDEDRALIQVELCYFSLCFLIPVMLTVFPFSFLLRKHGLKNFLVYGSFTTSLATAARCILVSLNIEENNGFILTITQVFIAIGTSMILICPPFLSTQWFPVHERRFATGVSQMSLYLGLAFGFIFSDKIADTLHDDGVHNLQNLLLGQTIVAICIYWLLIGFFPDVSISAPSVLQRSQRLPAKSSLKNLTKNGRLWLCLISAVLTSGSYFFMFYHISWVANHVGFYDKVANRNVMNLYALICVFFGMFFAFAVLKCSDRCHYLFGTMLLTCLILTINLIILAVSVTVFQDSLTIEGRRIFMILEGIISFACVVIVSPLFSEFIADFMYPVPEETTFALFTCTQMLLPTILSIIFLAGFIKNDKRFCETVIWVIAGATLLGTVIFTTLAKTKNKRKPLERGTRPRQSFGPNMEEYFQNGIEIGI